MFARLRYKEPGNTGLFFYITFHIFCCKATVCLYFCRIMDTVKYIAIGALAALLLAFMPQIVAVVGVQSFWTSVAVLLVCFIIGLGIDLFYVTKKLKHNS